jgi:filamentous hemagglutinin family protein
MDSLSRYAAIALLSVGLVANPVQAQVIPDNTLPTAVSSPDNRNFAIDGGSQSGANLFHSFSQFSVPTGGTAVFNNPLDVQNIFSRVTGGTVSNINGLIQTGGSANLFLLNPNGIVFGPNAKLNIGGSFLGTTASHIQFADGVAFSVTNPMALLTLSVPIGLQIDQSAGSSPLGAITVNGTGHALLLPSTYAPIVRTRPQTAGLQVKPNQTLALVGGNVTLNGGVLSAPQGRVEIISGGDGLVGLTSVAQGWRFNADSLQAYRDIQITNRSSIEASGAGNTAIQLVGKTIQIRDGSIALMVTQGSLPPGSFQIKASEAFQLSGLDQFGKFGSFIISDVFAGKGAEMTIAAPQMTLSNTAMIHARAFGKSQLGNIAINAATLQLDGQADTNPGLRTRISASNLGQSNAGTLTIAADQLNILNGGIISVSNLGSGLGGDVAIVANTLKIDGVSPFPEQSSLLTVSALGSGNAGNLGIQTQVLSVTGGSTINTSTLAGGNAGNLTINATRSVLVSGGSPLLNGAIDGSEIASAATVVARDVQQRLGLPPIPSGAAGSVTINTPSLKILDNATVKVDNAGLGNAGTLRINANSIDLKRGGTIEAATLVGEGGDLSLQAQTLVLRDRSVIRATAGGAGKGGNITIQSPIVLGLENSDIAANAVKGQGGNIQITTQGLLGLKFRDRLTPDNDITASSEFGVSGTVQVNAIGVNPSSGLVELPVDTIDPSQKIATGCATQNDSSFVATGRGGVPENPIQVTKIDRPWSDLRSITMATPKPRIATASMPIEARALATNAQGEIELIGEGAIASNPQGVNCSRQ